MKWIILLCIVLAEVTATSWYNYGSKTSSAQKRTKRHYYNRWNWGYYENPDAEWINEEARRLPQIKSRFPIVTAEPDPCDPVEAKPVPDFTAPNRRLSQVKCYEYIYEAKIRDDADKRKKACAESKAATKAALGGRDAKPGEFPHMGALGWKSSTGTWIFKCGGTLISEKFVLTAAHCGKASARDTSVADVEPKIVRLGDSNIIDIYDFQTGRFPVDGNISRIIVHPKYKSPSKYFDVALVELEDEVTFTKYIQPACLNSGPQFEINGKKATMTGWGVVETVGLVTSPVLQAAEVDVMDMQQCDTFLRPFCNRLWCGMQEHQLCAGKLEGGVDACQGDSGGPLQVNISLPSTTDAVMYHVIGVTSFGIGCGRKNLPGVYTRVSSFLDWIERTVWEDSYYYYY